MNVVKEIPEERSDKVRLELYLHDNKQWSATDASVRHPSRSSSVSATVISLSLMTPWMFNPIQSRHNQIQFLELAFIVLSTLDPNYTFNRRHCPCMCSAYMFDIYQEDFLDRRLSATKTLHVPLPRLIQPELTWMYILVQQSELESRSD